jgi:hypothetical protein
MLRKLLSILLLLSSSVALSAMEGTNPAIAASGAAPANSVNPAAAQVPAPTGATPNEGANAVQQPIFPDDLIYDLK